MQDRTKDPDSGFGEPGTSCVRPGHVAQLRGVLPSRKQSQSQPPRRTAVRAIPPAGASWACAPGTERGTRHSVSCREVHAHLGEDGVCSVLSPGSRTQRPLNERQPPFVLGGYHAILLRPLSAQGQALSILAPTSHRRGGVPPTADLWPAGTRTKVVFLVFWEQGESWSPKGPRLAPDPEAESGGPGVSLEETLCPRHPVKVLAPQQLPPLPGCYNPRPGPHRGVLVTAERAMCFSPCRGLPWPPLLPAAKTHTATPAPHTGSSWAATLPGTRQRPPADGHGFCRCLLGV